MSSNSGNDKSGVIKAAVIGAIATIMAACLVIYGNLVLETVKIIVAKLLEPAPVSDVSCGWVTDLAFQKDLRGQNSYSGIWNVTFKDSNSMCWYVIVGTGFFDSPDKKQITDLKPFRAGNKPKLDFLCDKQEFEVWALVEGETSDLWYRISDSFTISPDFCFPRTNVDINSILSAIQPGTGSIEKALPEWKPVDYQTLNGIFNPTLFSKYDLCYGIAWNANNQDHTVFVFQSEQPIEFQDGGTYVAICLQGNLVLSPIDVGRIQADWLTKEHGGTWRVKLLP